MTNKTKGRTPPPSATPSGPTVPELLGTDDAALQAQRVGELLRLAQPTRTLVIQLGPDGVKVTPAGVVDIDALYQMLDLAREAIRQEERRQIAALQAAAAPASVAEPTPA